MNRRIRFLLQSFFLFFVYSLSWIALWTISFYLHQSGQQAVLFLPQGLRIALMILLWRRYWPVLIISETLIISWLGYEQLIIDHLMILSAFISITIALLIQHYWSRYTLYWQRLSLLLAGIMLNSLLQAITLGFWLKSGASHTFLSSLTGGVLIAPFVYLIYEYLREQQFRTMIDAGTPDPQLRTSLLMWCFLLFLVGLSAQFLFSPEIEKILILFVFIPNIFMAYRYGWQGGVLAALLNSLFITSARQFNGSFSNINELEMFLTTQALIGIGLGIAISRQQQLANNLNRYRQRLEKELLARHQLMQQLVRAEEDVRKDIARELHDEIGQNITAIQIQSMLAKKSAVTPLAEQAAEQIHQLAQQIHLATRQLLRQLRPPVLDEMSLDMAIFHMINEFAFSSQGINCKLSYQIDETNLDETTTLTFYRLVQELLNNISKHAQATEITIEFIDQIDSTQLTVSDNGIGMSHFGITKDQHQSGMGLRGIEERVRALGGTWEVSNQSGTVIIVNLPTLSDQKPL
nr:MASE1 domain-containing protein [uncultured Moellerella sp.]